MNRSVRGRGVFLALLMFVSLVLFSLMPFSLAHAAGPRQNAAAASFPALPLPPVPPANKPAYEAAPMPNSAAQAPEVAAPQGIEVVPRLYHRRETQTGSGYTRGSEFRERDSESFGRVGPGINLRVPLK